MQKETAFQRCLAPACAATFDVGEILTACPKCGALLDAAYDWPRVELPRKLSEFEKKWATRRNPLHFSGVWRFKELLDFTAEKNILTIGEGQTLLRSEPEAARYTGLKKIYLQYEGLNPSGSFKDNGMTAGFSHARMAGATKVACASTGNTSASMAAFASAALAQTGQKMEALVFVGSGRIALGKLSQSLDYGARTIQLLGHFDDAMARVKEVCKSRRIYLLNSVNPFRLEGQKAIMYRVLEALRWEVPDWIVVPGGNLGNSSAFGKAFHELKELGLLKTLPRLAVINAIGANTLYRLFNEHHLRWNKGWYDQACVQAFYKQMDAEKRDANTLASAIEINRPVNLSKCLRALEWLHGVVAQVSDQEILDAKAIVGRGGIGCEPASAASVAGTKKLVAAGIIGKSERVVCIITGHQLKAANTTLGYHGLRGKELRKEFREFGVSRNRFANRPVRVKNDLRAILKILGV